MDEFTFENAVKTRLSKCFECSFNLCDLPSCSRSWGCPAEVGRGGVVICIL